MNNKNLLFAVILIKLILAGLFSSEYQHEFMKFTGYFVSGNFNPWEFSLLNGDGSLFPYSPFMLYFASIGAFFIKIFNLNNIFIVNIIFKLSLFIADASIYLVLLKLVKDKKFDLIIYYAFSPIILYSTYIHGQLDIIPTALFLLAVYMLTTKKYYVSFVLIGVALSTKAHIVAAIPLIIFCLYKSKRYRMIPVLLCICFCVYTITILPYYGEAYKTLVLNASEQMEIFKIYIDYYGIKLYLSIFIFTVLYIYLLTLNKINNKLLLNILGVIFGLFVLIIKPMPGWYLWCIPYISLFFITEKFKTRFKAFFVFILNFLYITYFVTLHSGKKIDIFFLSTSLNFIKIDDVLVRNTVFSSLQATMFLCVLLMFIYGIKNNLLYKNNNSFVIGVGGNSGSGKSTLLDSIYKLLGRNNVLNIEGDGDHKWERGNEKWTKYTHLDPKANYLYRQMQDLQQLKQYRTIKRVEYDHNTGKFTEPLLVKAKNYITICGLHVLYLPQMRKQIDLKVYMDISENLRIHWKILRDIHKRGYTKEQVLVSEEQRVADAGKYIYPQKDYADLLIGYFDDTLLEPGEPDYDVKMGVSYEFNSDVNIEYVLSMFDGMNMDYIHDYSLDLEKQKLVIYNCDVDVDFDLLCNPLKGNMDDLLIGDIEWEKGVSGFNQLIMLYLIDYTMRSRSDNTSI